jgi:antitoxin (DNA-binding transcriptional repressor) of toxin-antitoxin stability system
MTKEQTSVDITGSNPTEILRLLRQLVASGRRLVLTVGETPVADVAPVKPTRGARGRRQGLTEDDPIWGIVGKMTRSPDGATDVSANTDKYLADAYLGRKEV